MSEVINWLTRNPNKYAIFGASIYDGMFDTWANEWTLEQFLDAVADGWDTHFKKSNMQYMRGHSVFFYPEGDLEGQWQVEDWDGGDSEYFLSEFVKMIEKHWDKNWTCGFSHQTGSGRYETNWRRYNV